MVAVHQFVPTLAPRDAVGGHYMRMRATLRDAGYASDIYAMEAKGEFAREAKPFQSFTGGRGGEPTWLCYHASIGSPVADFVAARPEPLIVDYHNITPATFFDRWEPSLAVYLRNGRSQLRALAPRARLGLADSAYNALELDDLGYRRTAVVPILFDRAELHTEVDEAARRRLVAARPAGSSVWLFVGRVAPHKAQHDVVKALAAYRRAYDPDARLRIVGGASSPNYEHALTAYVDELGLADAVEITGSVPDAVLGAHYATADVYVSLSDHEGFCVPLLEAMHHGLPVVAFGAGAVPETVGAGGIVLDRKDPPTVAAAVARVVSDGSVREELVRAGHARVEHFALARSQALLRDAIASVVRET